MLEARYYTLRIIADNINIGALKQGSQLTVMKGSSYLCRAKHVINQPKNLLRSDYWLKICQCLPGKAWRVSVRFLVTSSMIECSEGSRFVAGTTRFSGSFLF